MKKTVFAVSLVILLCALFVKPDVLPKVVSSAETAQSTRVHAAWKQQARQSGDVRTLEEGVYYTQTPDSNIVPLGTHFAFVNNEVIVYFKDGTSLEKKKAVFQDLNAEVIGYTDILNKYQLRLPEEKSFSGRDEAIMMMVLSEQEICSMSWARNALVSVFSRLRTFTFF